MREVLEKALKPAIDSFIDSLLREYAPLKDKESYLVTREEQLKESEASNRSEQDKFILYYNKHKQELDDKKNAYETKLDELNIEFSEVRRAKTETERLKKEADDYLKATRADQKKASELREEAERLRGKHSQKLAYLKVEDDKLEAKRLEIKDKEDRTRAKERELLIEAQKISEQKSTMEKLALDLAIKEKRIKFELRKLQLKD